ncbi:hypothetical protein OG984_06420 [Nocardioides sp. NBC_00368]|uniref:hypothetical protein n=1 Tax=Nocardioides sp. NBC_00368 TaxID=2976000 RepID=UPI002E226897
MNAKNPKWQNIELTSEELSSIPIFDPKYSQKIRDLKIQKMLLLDPSAEKPKRKTRAELVEMYTNDDGVYINSKGIPNTHMQPGERPKVRSWITGLFPAGPGRPKGLDGDNKLVGEVFGELVVLEEREKRDGRNWTHLCRCSCGNESWVRKDRLVSGKTKSCGCLKKGRPTKRQQAEKTVLKMLEGSRGEWDQWDAEKLLMANLRVPEELRSLGALEVQVLKEFADWDEDDDLAA